MDKAAEPAVAMAHSPSTSNEKGRRGIHHDAPDAGLSLSNQIKPQGQPLSQLPIEVLMSSKFTTPS